MMEKDRRAATSFIMKDTARRVNFAVGLFAEENETS